MNKTCHLISQLTKDMRKSKNYSHIYQESWCKGQQSCTEHQKIFVYGQNHSQFVFFFSMHNFGLGRLWNFQCGLYGGADTSRGIMVNKVCRICNIPIFTKTFLVCSGINHDLVYNFIKWTVYLMTEISVNIFQNISHNCR